MKAVVCPDEDIIELFLQRNETAIAKTQNKYGRLLFDLALRITNSRETSEEVVNDTLMRLWTTLITANKSRPDSLLAYSMKIARNLAVDRVRAERAAKRPQTVCELDEAITESIVTSFEQPDESKTEMLAEEIDLFLASQKPEHRRIFVMRYFSEKSIEEIAQKTGMTKNAVKSLLKRMRRALRERLEREGYRI